MSIGAGDDAGLWQQADEAFDRLLDIAPEQRDAALAAMSLPAAVRALVLQLLASDSQAGPLDDPHRLLSSLDEAEPPSALCGRRLGEWILGEEIGRGGMSVVYAAERPIGTSRQSAALKLLTLGALAGHGYDRFMREQAILARLEHANIAALLDAGVLEDGTPWMAMVRIDGIHIDRWCRERRLDIRAIVSLFLDVCDTVEFAHRNLVIHRDIKPSNVLVDGDGRIHLLDFGIARLIEADTDQATRTLAVTPRYAAPEQLAGDNPSTGMDVYGLGALLYCLLTGEPPRTLSLLQPHAPAPLASRSCQQPYSQHARQLRGDLDALLAKALAESPRERYATPGELAADLRNWLAGRPVGARRQGGLYRLRKFAGRHRWGVAASTVLLLSVAAGVTASLWQARVASANAARANAVKDFMVQIFQASAPDIAAGKDPPASELLQRGAERVRRQFAEQPALLAQMLTVIGTTQQERGLLADATRSLDAAIEAFGRTGRPTVEYAQALKARANLYYDRGRMQQALSLFEQADRVAAQAGLKPISTLRADITVLSANAQIESNHPEKAEPNLLALLKQLRGAGLQHSSNYVHALDILGASLAALNRSDEAVARLQEALRAQATLKSNPTLKCDILTDLGIAQIHGHHYQESIDTYRRAIKCGKQYYGDQHQMTQAAMSNLAWILNITGHPDEAAEQYEKLLPVIRRTVGTQPSVDGAVTLGMMALARDAAGRDDALDAIRRAYAERQKLDNPRGPQTAWIEQALGLLLFERNLPEADQHLGEYMPVCNRIGALQQTKTRICIALLLRASERKQCPLDSHTDPSDQMHSAAQQPWLAGYWLVRKRCADEPMARQHAAARLQQTLKGMQQLPAWLARRLPDAGPVTAKPASKAP